jgi:hypothetical protein
MDSHLDTHHPSAEDEDPISLQIVITMDVVDRPATLEALDHLPTQLLDVVTAVPGIDEVKVAGVLGQTWVEGTIRPPDHYFTLQLTLTGGRDEDELLEGGQ